MITIFYGEDIAASRTAYIADRSQQQQKVILDGGTLTVTDLLQALSGGGLFGDQQAICIEELLSKRKSSKDLDALIQELLDAHNQTAILLWESKELTAKQLAPFKGAVLKQFKVPQTVFAFLDALYPGNSKKLITLFHDLLKDEDAAFALFMLQRQTRLLLTLLDGGEPLISETKRLAPWQKGKLQKQAKAFSREQLVTLHDRLYHLELGQKTGGLSMPLEQEINFLLMSF